MRPWCNARPLPSLPDTASIAGNRPQFGVKVRGLESTTHYRWPSNSWPRHNVEPREIIAPGTPNETNYRDPNPQKLGLLVAPAKVVLETGQRKWVRFAAIHGDEQGERVYRVTVKPVVGQLSKYQAGLKILIGYDVLVLSRSTTITLDVEGRRAGNA